MQTVGDLMTPEPLMLDEDRTVIDAARAMKERDIGNVLVRFPGNVYGIVTDRDIVVRWLAGEAKDAASQRLGDVCSRDLAAVAADASIGDAFRLMAERAIRRLLVLRDGEPVGIVSLGDLAIAEDGSPTLRMISAAEPNGYES